MKQHAFEQLRPHLAPGEVLLWCGRPAKGFRLTGKTVMMGVLLFFLTCVWLMVVPAAIARGQWPAVVVVTLMCGLFWFAVISEKLALRRAVYGVTDRRVIVSDSLIGGAEKSISYRNLRGVVLTGNRSFGTICCHRTSMNWKDQSKQGRVTHPALFRRISDAGAVYDLIIEQQEHVVGIKHATLKKESTEIVNVPSANLPVAE